MVKNEIAATVKSFEDIKHVDENGREYWNAHELSKALGYVDYRKFVSAMNRAKTQMRVNGINPEDHLVGSDEMVEIGSGATRTVSGFKLDRRAAYTTAMNADPSKQEVAVGQEYFLQNTATVEAIEKRMKDAIAIENRNILRVANKALNNEILARDVEPEEIGMVLNKGDEGFFNKTTKELKEENGIPNNRPIADFMNSDLMAYKAVAQVNSRREIQKYDLHGVKDIGEAMYDENRKMRDMYMDKFEDAPENTLPGEDIKKVTRKYTKQTAKYLEALNHEN